VAVGGAILPCYMPGDSRVVWVQVVYILDQVRAMEQEMKKRLRASGLDHVVPRILVVTRLIPDNKGTKCNQVRGTPQRSVGVVP
jgi:sucrose synthase